MLPQPFIIIMTIITNFFPHGPLSPPHGQVVCSPWTSPPLLPPHHHGLISGTQTSLAGVPLRESSLPIYTHCGLSLGPGSPQALCGRALQGRVGGGGSRPPVHRTPALRHEEAGPAPASLPAGCAVCLWAGAASLVLRISH